jgi:hypothetical protein
MAPLGDTVRGLLRRPCQCCGHLGAQEICLGCLHHCEVFGHFPKEVRWPQVPGQPRVLTRCCNKEEEHYVTDRS